MAAFRSIALVLCMVVCEDDETERVVGVADGIRREQGAEGGAARSSQDCFGSLAQCASSAVKGSESRSGGSNTSGIGSGVRAHVWKCACTCAWVWRRACACACACPSGSACPRSSDPPILD